MYALSREEFSAYIICLDDACTQAAYAMGSSRIVACQGCVRDASTEPRSTAPRLRMPTLERHVGQKRAREQSRSCWLKLSWHKTGVESCELSGGVKCFRLKIGKQ